MEGSVTLGLQPVLPLAVFAPDGTEVEITALVDTGFSGYLVLSPETIETMSLIYDRKEEYTVGNNEDVQFDLYTGAKVRWHGHEKEIVVMAVEGEAVLGMELLRGSRLFVEAKPNGRVQVAEENEILP